MAINMRYPYWATSGIELKVNGEKQNITTQPGSYITLDREWKTGDTIELAMPFRLRFESFHDDGNKAAVMYGPLVMCAWTTKDNPVSVIRGDKSKVLKVLKPVRADLTPSPPPRRFSAPHSRRRMAETTFVPFYKEYNKPYTVYWEIYDDARWAAKEAEMKAEKERQRILDARRVDGLEFFDQAERDHNFKGEKTVSGDHNGRRWRHVTRAVGSNMTSRCSPISRRSSPAVTGAPMAAASSTSSSTARKSPPRNSRAKNPTSSSIGNTRSRPTCSKARTSDRPIPAGGQQQAGGVFGCSIMKDQ